MTFDTPQEEFLQESSNILYGEHHAMYPIELQAETVSLWDPFYTHTEICSAKCLWNSCPT
jgi:hypothetical protein